MTTTSPRQWAAAGGFLACILAANFVTTHYGMVWVFGLTATAGTYFAGLSFVLRDAVQDAAGRRAVLALIAAGAGLSYLLADPFIATASAVAFLASESADFAVYTPLRRKGYVRAAVASNVVGAFVDTFLFLWIAGFPLAAWQGQVVGKLAVTVAVVALVALVRPTRAHRLTVHPDNAQRLKTGVWSVEVRCDACRWNHRMVIADLARSSVEAGRKRMADLHDRTRRSALLRESVR